MNASMEFPTYNLKAVIHETGVKPDTLRAWERRYGLPNPERTTGGHRLYSQRDIDTVHWLVARQEEGLSISHAVNLWHALEAEGKDPLAEMRMAEQDTATSTVTELSKGDPITTLRQKWIAACMAFDEPAAQHALNQAFALFAPEHACFEILQKGLGEIGRGWYEGRVSVQQEHFASALAVRRLDALLMATPPPTRAGRILVGCPPDEQHTFSPLLLLLLLRRQGWDAIYLGVNVPLEQMQATIERTHADLIILSAQQLHTAASLMEMTRMLARHGNMVAYGGLIFNARPRIQARIPGHFLGERLEDAARNAARLLHTRPAPPAAHALPLAYEQALAEFTDRSPLVEAQTWQELAQEKIPPALLTRANHAMADNISAALKLGDITLVAEDISWLEGLLFNYRVAPGLLRHYLQAYRRALQNNLNERGEIVVAWMSRLLAEEQSVEDETTSRRVRAARREEVPA